jgi:Mg-chelatase subunit ChlD
MTSSSESTNGAHGGQLDQPTVLLEMHPERRLIGRGSHRHVDFRIHVATQRQPVDRRAVAVGLVIDRSGSMHGDKVDTARRAALAVLDRLNGKDRVAVVIFDDRIDVLQNGALATPEVKARLREQVLGVQARGSTALHAGWLAGCRAIAPDSLGSSLARCFLLTDGLANIGLTDAERIASEVADVREHAGVGTSTFGIGNDYDESLLGPMAVAGGGQFHNLRTAEEIAHTFVGELGELLSVAAANVRLVVEVGPGTAVEVVSPYPQRQLSATRWSIAVGDLLSEEDRRVVVRFAFNSFPVRPAEIVRGRLEWRSSEGVEQHGPWQEIAFEAADSEARRAETADPLVLQIVGQHHATRAQTVAHRQSRQGDLDGARTTLKRVAQRIRDYAGDDPQLRQAIVELEAAQQQLVERGYDSARSKEGWYLAAASARGQRDLRQP